MQGQFHVVFVTKPYGKIFRHSAVIKFCVAMIIFISYLFMYNFVLFLTRFSFALTYTTLLQNTRRRTLTKVTSLETS